MSQYEHFILQKPVNWSLLNHGISIPISSWSLLQIIAPNILTHGNSKPIKIIVDNEMFDAVLVNQNFDRSKYPSHKDIIQIRYSDQSPISQKLRLIFHESYNYFIAQRKMLSNARKQVALPNDISEFIRLYSTNNSDVFHIECNTNYEYNQVSNALSTITEELYESANDDTFLLKDKTATIEEKERIVKYRKIDRSIIARLKEYYDYRDEISGEKIGAEYGESVVEAHHIDYFTLSQNNDTTNIIIISPNYHRIIHKNNPIFNRKKFQFEFPNGEILKLKLYDHLLI